MWIRLLLFWIAISRGQNSCFTGFLTYFYWSYWNNHTLPNDLWMVYSSKMKQKGRSRKCHKISLEMKAVGKIK